MFKTTSFLARSYLNTQTRFFANALYRRRVLVTGCQGQIGTPLVHALCEEIGEDNVIAADTYGKEVDLPCKFEKLDVTDADRYDKVVADNKIDYIVHMAALMPELGEGFPDRATKVNVNGCINALNIARDRKARIFVPSTIAVFGGKNFPKDNTPVDTVLQPETNFGEFKEFNEFISKYYDTKFGVDLRSIRYPGVISSQINDSNGITDYSTEMFHHAIEKQYYKCWLGPKTALPIIHIDDCIDGTILFLRADQSLLKRKVYSMGGITYTPEELAESIKKIIPEFKIDYKPDSRQKIADKWPKSIDDQDSKNDWGWSYDITVDELARKIMDEIAPEQKENVITPPIGMGFIPLRPNYSDEEQEDAQQEEDPEETTTTDDSWSFGDWIYVPIALIIILLIIVLVPSSGEEEGEEGSRRRRRSRVHSDHIHHDHAIDLVHSYRQLQTQTTHEKSTPPRKQTQSSHKKSGK